MIAKTNNNEYITDLQRFVSITYVIHVKIHVSLYYTQSFDVSAVILVPTSCIIMINISFITLIVVSSRKHAQVLLKNAPTGKRLLPLIYGVLASCYTDISLYLARSHQSRIGKPDLLKKVLSICILVFIYFSLLSFHITFYSYYPLMILLFLNTLH